jgi:hypothetical protein
MPESPLSSRHVPLSHLLAEYSKHSLLALDTSCHPAGSELKQKPEPAEAPASIDPWQVLMRSLSKARKTELQTHTRDLISAWKGRSFNKAKLLNNVKHTLFDYEYKPTLTDKFFVLWAANGDTFAFKYSKWVFYACKENFHPETCRIMTIDEAGRVVGLPVTDSSDPTRLTHEVDSPWSPVKARGRYKKSDLADLARAIGADDSGAAHVIYQNLLSELQSLPLTN